MNAKKAKIEIINSNGHTPNDEYENFVNVYIEVTAECILNQVKCRVPQE